MTFKCRRAPVPIRGRGERDIPMRGGTVSITSISGNQGRSLEDASSLLIGDNIRILETGYVARPGVTGRGTRWYRSLNHSLEAESGSGNPPLSYAMLCYAAVCDDFSGRRQLLPGPKAGWVVSSRPLLPRTSVMPSPRQRQKIRTLFCVQMGLGWVGYRGHVGGGGCAVAVR